MGLFFMDKKPSSGNQSGKNRQFASVPPDERERPKPHTSGQVTPREFRLNVVGRWRRSGLSQHDIDMAKNAAAGFLDKDPSGGIGMNYREKGEFVDHLKEDAHRLGLDKKDIARIDEALDQSL